MPGFADAARGAEPGWPGRWRSAWKAAPHEGRIRSVLLRPRRQSRWITPADRAANNKRRGCLMDFSYFLSSYMPDAAYGGKRVYADMVEQAVTAEKLGYRGVAIPEHHLINILMVPSPLQMAVKIATLTHRMEIMTSVVVLP